MTFDEAMQRLRGVPNSSAWVEVRQVLAIGTEVERLRKMLEPGATTGGNVGEGTVVFDAPLSFEDTTPEALKSIINDTLRPLIRSLSDSRRLVEQAAAEERRRLEAELAAARQTATGLYDRNVAVNADCAELRKELARIKDEPPGALVAAINENVLLANRLDDMTRRAEKAEQELRDFTSQVAKALKIGA